MLEPGAYLGTITDHAVQPAKNGNPQIVFQFSVAKVCRANEWADLDPKQSARWYASILKRDGTALRRNVDIIMAALGLTGFDLGGFGAGEFKGRAVQVYCENQDGGPRITAIYSEDFDGEYGVGPPLVSANIADLKSKFGNAFKEFAPANKPAAPAATAAPAPAPANEVDAAKRKCWTDYKLANTNMTPAALNSTWKEWHLLYVKHLGRALTVATDWESMTQFIANNTKPEPEPVPEDDAILPEDLPF